MLLTPFRSYFVKLELVSCVSGVQYFIVECCYLLLRRCSKQQFEVMTGLGVSTAPILLYAPNLVTSQRGQFYSPIDLDKDSTDLSTSRQ